MPQESSLKMLPFVNNLHNDILEMLVDNVVDVISDEYLAILIELRVTL